MPDLNPALLAALTHVAMPAIGRGEALTTTVYVAGMSLPVVTTAALVVGSPADRSFADDESLGDRIVPCLRARSRDHATAV